MSGAGFDRGSVPSRIPLILPPYCMAAFSVTGNPLILQTGQATPGITLTPNQANIAGALQASAITGNNISTAYVTAQAGNSASNVSTLSLPLLGDQSQAWCKVSSASAFQASLTVGNDSNGSNYMSGLTSTTGNLSGIVSAPSAAFSNGVVIMSNCAPTVTHFISIRASNPVGVLDIITCGSQGTGNTAAVFRTAGAVQYSGTTPGNVQVSFNPAVSSARFGVQSINYN